jgi:triosephosphate isomerase
MKIIAGNWKMHKTLGEMESFFKELNLPPAKNQRRILALSPTLLQGAQKIAPDHSVEIFSQNCWGDNQGAFTGEISPLQLRDIGIKGSLVGHSERRQYFGETDDSCIKRTEGLWNNELEVIYCIGEKLNERNQGETEEVLARQLSQLIALYKQKIQSSTSSVFSKLILAYEPVWAIGTGLTANSEQITAAHVFIFNEFKNAGLKDTEIPPILYGGSVKTSNFKEITALPKVSGGLVGGASLKAADYSLLCQS